jgi:hypothetical protein
MLKYSIFFLFLSSKVLGFSNLAPVRYQLRQHLWIYGLNHETPSKKVINKKQLSEELERALKNI